MTWKEIGEVSWSGRCRCTFRYVLGDGGGSTERGGRVV